MVTSPIALRFIGGLVGVVLTAASLTVTTAYAQTGFERTGYLLERESDFHSVYLRAGTTYRFRATCDIDCSDVDLRLFSPSGRLEAEDVLSDDVPLFIYTARITGTYQLQVRMFACSLEPCGYRATAEVW